MPEDMNLDNVTNEEIDEILESIRDLTDNVDTNVSEEEFNEMLESVNDNSDTNESTNDASEVIENDELNALLDELEAQANSVEERQSLFEASEDYPVEEFVNPITNNETEERQMADIFSNFDANRAIDSLEEEVNTVTNEVVEDDFKVGDFINVTPTIADAIPDYDPSDKYRITNIDNGIVSLSRNGENVPYLAAIPTGGIMKSDYVEADSIEATEATSSDVVEEIVENVAESEATDKPIIIEKGSKPIRWASNFIDKVKKNMSVESISKKLAESIKKDEEKALETGEQNLDGKSVSFKTALYSKELKVAKSASKGWKKITGWLKKDKENEDDKFFENVDNNTEVVESVEEQAPVVREETTMSEVTNSVGASAKPYEAFERLSEDKQAAVLEDLFAGLKFLQEQLKIEKEYNVAAQQRIESNEAAINKASEVVKEAAAEAQALIEENNKLKEQIALLEANQIENKEEEIVGETAQENVEETTEENVEEVTEENVEEATEENVEEATEENVEEATEENVEEATEENVEEAIEENVEEAIEENVEEVTEEKDKPIIDEQYVKYDLEQYNLKDQKLNPKMDEMISQENDEITSTFTEEEIAADKERRRKENYSYDREKQADYEMFWQNQAAYTQTPEYQQAAFERATEDIAMKKEEYENSFIGQTAEEKAEWKSQRAALIERNKAEAKRNEFMTNVHYGTYNDDQIAAMLSALNNNEDTKGKSK